MPLVTRDRVAAGITTLLVAAIVLGTLPVTFDAMTELERAGSIDAAISPLLEFAKITLLQILLFFGVGVIKSDIRSTPT